MELPTAGNLILNIARLRSNFTPNESNCRSSDVLDFNYINDLGTIEEINWVVDLP